MNERGKSPQIIQNTKAVRFPVGVASAELWLFEVQDATAADGIYQCYKQTSFGNYGPPVIEVLNLIENYTVSSYTNALAKGDKLACFQMADENGTMRWVGIPMVPSVRLAKTRESVGASKSIKANLISSDGTTEIETGLGSNIDVNCKITRDIALTEYNLNQASPRLADDTYMLVENISGKWYCVTVFQCVINCGCTNP